MRWHLLKITRTPPYTFHRTKAAQERQGATYGGVLAVLPAQPPAAGLLAASVAEPKGTCSAERAAQSDRDSPARTLPGRRGRDAEPCGRCGPRSAARLPPLPAPQRGGRGGAQGPTCAPSPRCREDAPVAAAGAVPPSPSDAAPAAAAPWQRGRRRSRAPRSAAPRPRPQPCPHPGPCCWPGKGKAASVRIHRDPAPLHCPRRRGPQLQMHRTLNPRWVASHSETEVWTQRLARAVARQILIPLIYWKIGKTARNKTRTNCPPAQKSASLLSYSPISGICIGSSGASLFQFSTLPQDFTSAGHLFPEIPRVNAHAPLSPIQTLPLLEPTLVTQFMILHHWHRCVLSASSPDSGGPWRKEPCSFRFYLLLNFLV